MPEKLSGEFQIAESPSSENENVQEEKESSEEESAPKPEKPEKKSTSHFFSSFCYYPKNVKFANQEHDEEIILLIRRRFIVNLPWIITSLILAVAGPFLIILTLNSFPIAPLTPVQYFVAITFFLLVIFGFMLMKFTLWYFHVGIVTNKRIKDVDIHGVLFKDIAETKIDQIQDVSNKQIGFLPSLFNFGDVFVQTAGANPNIEFDKAPEPVRIARILGEMIRKH